MRKEAIPHGIVMISTQQMIPASMYASQSQKPLKTNQMILSRVRTDLGSHWPLNAAIGRFPELSLAGCLSGECVVRSLIEKNKSDFRYTGVGCPHRLQRYPSGIVDRPTVDAGRDRGKGYGRRPEFVRDGKRVAEAVGKQLRLVLGLGVGRPDGVDHPAGLEPPGCGCNGLTCG